MGSYSGHPRDVPYSVLLKQYTPLIANTARSMGWTPKYSPPRSHGMVWEDALQAARIGLWQAAESFNPGLADSFLAYAWTKCRYEVSNEWRRCQAMKDSRRREAEEYDHREYWDIPDVSDPWAQIEDQEWLDIIDASIKRMDLKRRNIFQGAMLHDGGGPKWGRGIQYCDALGISPSRATQLRTDIRRKLKAELN